RRRGRLDGGARCSPSVLPLLTPSAHFPCSLSGLTGLLRRQRFLGFVEQFPADVGAVLGQRLRDAGLVDAMEVPDCPIELLKGVIGRTAVAVLLAGTCLGLRHRNLRLARGGPGPWRSRRAVLGVQVLVVL